MLAPPKTKGAPIDTPEISEPKCDSEYERGIMARDRLVVLLNWFWAYWSYQRGARIILGSDEDQAGSTRQA